MAAPCPIAESTVSLALTGRVCVYNAKLFSSFRVSLNESSISLMLALVSAGPSAVLVVVYHGNHKQVKMHISNSDPEPLLNSADMTLHTCCIPTGVLGPRILTHFVASWVPDCSQSLPFANRAVSLLSAYIAGHSSHTT